MVYIETRVAFVLDCFCKDICAVSSLGRWSLHPLTYGGLFPGQDNKSSIFPRTKVKHLCLPPFRRLEFAGDQDSSAVTHTRCVQRLFLDPHHPLCGISGHRKEWKYEASAVSCSVYWIIKSSVCNLAVCLQPASMKPKQATGFLAWNVHQTSNSSPFLRFLHFQVLLCEWGFIFRSLVSFLVPFPGVPMRVLLLPSL